MARVAFVLLDNKFLQVRNMPETALLFPDLAPKTDVSNDSNQPLQIIIHSEVFQKVGSTIAEIIPIIKAHTRYFSDSACIYKNNLLQ